jgi:SAM-dependent methyltransferase
MAQDASATHVRGVGHVLDVANRYAFRNAQEIQRDRLRTLESLLDPGTKRVLEPLMAPGARCLEVGAGGGSIAAWLADRDGDVLATDLDVTVLRELQRPNLEVRVHNLVTDELPAAEFDLIHLRLVLAWLTDTRRALAKLVAALKPGGHLVAEEMDFGSVAGDPAHPDADLFARVARAHDTALAVHHDFDPYYGRRLVGELAAFTHVQCDGRVAMWRGGEAGGEIWRLTLLQLRDEMDVPPEAVDRVIALCDDPRFWSMSPIVMAAWGRRR